jgi:hypothetical protein
MMVSGQQPSTSSRGADSEHLEAARGSVRDSLGSIRNVEQLLKSIKVGPKALAAVIPDVHASCGPLLESFHELLEALAGFGTAPREIEAFVTPRIRELEAALASSLATPMHAKQRLALESVVSRVAGELDAARGLVELLESTRGAAAVPVQLVDVARDAAMLPEAGEIASGKTVTVTLDAGDSHETPVNPRLASRLFRIAVGLIAAQDSAPHVTIDCTDAHRSRVAIGLGPGTGESLTLHTPRLIDCTLVCAVAAAEATSCRFELAEDRQSVLLTWPLTA